MMHSCVKNVSHFFSVDLKENNRNKHSDTCSIKWSHQKRIMIGFSKGGRAFAPEVCVEICSCLLEVFFWPRVADLYL